MKNKVFKTIIKRLITIAIVGVVIYFSPLIIPLLLHLSYSEPAKPAVVYGEFPFEIVLEVDGETKVFNDIYVCEYDVSSNKGVGKFRDWKGYIKGTGESELFIKEANGKRIYCSVGSAAYYMDDTDDVSPYSQTPRIFSKEKSGTRLLKQIFNEADLNEYNIKIVSYKFSDAIENSFS